MSKIKPYISLMRPNYQINFIEVMVGISFVVNTATTLTWLTGLKIMILFITFSLFYGGIYTINDIADVEEDKKDIRKKLRVLPSGKVTLLNASLFAIFLLGTGFFSALAFLGVNIASIFLLFLIINLFYTFLLKKIPLVELLTNCLTHPLRLILGATLFSASIPSAFLIAYYFFILGYGLKLRLIMMENNGEVSRPTLRFYTAKRNSIMKFSFLIVGLLIALQEKGAHVGWYFVLTFLYIIFVYDFSVFRPVSKSLRRLYIGNRIN